MKFQDLDYEIQKVAANLLASAFQYVDLTSENRTEKAKEIAETVREAFETLFND